MKRTTLILLAILAIGLGSLLFAMKTYTDQFAQEIRRAKEVTEEVADRLEPGTFVKLARVAGQAKYVVADPERPGLLLEARPRSDAWAKDPTGEALAQDLANRLFAAYGPDRPVTWIQFRLTRPDGSEAPVFGLERERGDKFRRIPGPGAR